MFFQDCSMPLSHMKQWVAVLRIVNSVTIYLRKVASWGQNIHIYNSIMDSTSVYHKTYFYRIHMK